RSPGRVGCTNGSRQAAFVATGQIDLPDRGFARIPLSAEELDDPAVGSPGRGFVLPTVGEMTQSATVGAHHGNAQVARNVREGNLVSARAPFRSRSPSAEEAYSTLITTVHVHHIDLLVAGTVAFEHDTASVGRVRAPHVDPRRIRQALWRTTACRGYRIYVGVAPHSHRVKQPAPVWRPARRKGGIGAFGHQGLPPSADVVDIDARIAVEIADVGDLRVVRGVARRERRRLAIGYEAVIGPIRVHDREPLHAVILGTGLSDVGDLGIEERALPG